MPRNPDYNLPHLKQFRRDLRNHGTAPEAILWKGLKNKQVKGKRFRRQFSVGNYILDFFCPSEKLAVEVDGAHHFTEEGVAYDKEREEYLASHGIRVIRFRNAEVYQSTAAVLEVIAGYIRG